MPDVRVLIIEDNDMNRDLLVDYLGAIGYTVYHAGTAGEGIEKAESLRPDIILMDLRLPDMNGLDATVRLKEAPATQHIPVVAVTAHAMAEDEERAIGAGCSAYIAKPVSFPLLKRTIEALQP